MNERFFWLRRDRICIGLHWDGWLGLPRCGRDYIRGYDGAVDGRIYGVFLGIILTVSLTILKEWVEVID